MSNLASRFINGALPASSTDLFPSRMERTQLDFHFHDPAPFCPKDVSIYIYITNIYNYSYFSHIILIKWLGPQKNATNWDMIPMGRSAIYVGSHVSLGGLFEVTAAVKNDPAAFQWASKVGPMLGWSQKKGVTVELQRKFSPVWTPQKWEGLDLVPLMIFLELSFGGIFQVNQR